MSGLDFYDLPNIPLSGWAMKGNPRAFPVSASKPPAETPPSPAWGMAALIFGELTQAYANFNAVQMAKIETQAQASSFSHRARMLDLDRRNAEKQAQSILEQGQSEIGNVTLEGGQRRADIEATQAARGVDSSSGSAAEALASEKLVQAIDVYHINLNTVRAASAARAGAVAAGNEALFSRVSASNLRRSARVASPEAQLIAGLGNAGLSAYALSNYRKR